MSFELKLISKIYLDARMKCAEVEKAYNETNKKEINNNQFHETTCDRYTVNKYTPRPNHFQVNGCGLNSTVLFVEF